MSGFRSGIKSGPLLKSDQGIIVKPDKSAPANLRCGCLLGNRNAKLLEGAQAKPWRVALPGSLHLDNLAGDEFGE